MVVDTSLIEELRKVVGAHRLQRSDLVSYYGTCSCGNGGWPVDFETEDEWASHIDIAIAQVFAK